MKSLKALSSLFPVGKTRYSQLASLVPGPTLQLFNAICRKSLKSWEWAWGWLYLFAPKNLKLIGKQHFYQSTPFLCLIENNASGGECNFILKDVVCCLDHKKSWSLFFCIFSQWKLVKIGSITGHCLKAYILTGKNGTHYCTMVKQNIFKAI